jgi:hypothetical protein
MYIILTSDVICHLTRDANIGLYLQTDTSMNLCSAMCTSKILPMKSEMAPVSKEPFLTIS